ncbi:hypothetical protein PISMIDRAFT_328725 [Pisolithus microcarpus 441]|uniref:Uncharacterized protein n=1 Tax=Pisolithus microcarpus 441 TaxID=765257 RepID=A0A0C9YYS8_9AGAM|nr:hypothetical protein PISMIDRAFT_328725 [Pisolithus microcarpus 441]
MCALLERSQRAEHEKIARASYPGFWVTATQNRKANAPEPHIAEMEWQLTKLLYILAGLQSSKTPVRECMSNVEIARNSTIQWTSVRATIRFSALPTVFEYFECSASAVTKC